MDTATARAKSIPRQRKLSYFSAMDESAFRDRIVRPLMLRLGFESGRDLCGPDEEGKDAIFLERTRLNTMELVAVQTKKGNINMSQAASKNLLNAIAQLRTALETSIPLIRERRRQRPSKVILCSSGTINAKARDHIVSEIRDERISFLDADELINLIDEKYPEVWFGIETELVPYFRAIQAMIEGGVVHEQGAPSDPAQDLLQRAATDDRFVQIKLFRSFTKLQKTALGRVERVPSFEEIDIEDLLQRREQKILILGEGGSGKSTAVRRLAYQYARAGIGEDSSYHIPVVMSCSDVAANKNANLLETIEGYCCRVANTSHPCFTEDDLIKGKMLLCVDALDEVADAEERIAVVDKVCDFHAAFPRNTVIITSRMYSYLQEIERLADFARYTVSPIGLKQAAKIVDNVQASASVKTQNQRELLRRLEDVHGIELSPLLVTVFAATSEYDRSDIPANITELFKKFTELMLGRWDESKGLSQQYQAPLKDFICQRIAFTMHKNKTTRIAYLGLREIIVSLLSERGYKADSDAILSEIVQRSGLFRRIGEEVEFRHHLLQEFFAGRAIPNTDFIEEVVGNEWWTRPIVFYYGDNPEDIDSLAELATRTLSKPEMLFTAGTTIGLALQACYLSEVDKKVDLWKIVCTALAISTVGLARSESKGLRYPLNRFIVNYLMGRDGVALANLRDEIHRVRIWWENSDLNDARERDAIGFWLLVGLVEIGDFDNVADILESYEPEDTRYLLAIHLGCFLSAEVRALDQAERAKAQAIVGDLAPKIEQLRREFLEEFRNELLEIRKGKIEEVTRDLAGESM